MPLYEYQCNECEHHFELLRPAREAAQAQPCPECDADSRRVMSKQWSAFVYRDGRPRQLPDDGGYWHLGQKVSKPLTSAIDGIQHPEVTKIAPPKPLSVEELERYEYQQEMTNEQIRTSGDPVMPVHTSEAERTFSKRVRAKGTRREEQVKKRVRSNVSKLEYQRRNSSK